MATIFCFTSTGNSLYTAKMLAEKIDGKVLPMNSGLNQCDDDVIGFVFPVYFWGLPRIVERFISEIKITNKDAYIFTVATCGGPVFGVLGRMKTLMKSKGIPLQYGTQIISVTNYLPEYDIKDNDTIREKINVRLLKVAGDIKDRTSNRVAPYGIINKMAYKTYPDSNCDSFFTISQACDGCTICQKVCPVGNIAIENGKPLYQHQCEFCLACLHSCPALAIDWKQKTQGKDRFRNANITLNELIGFNSQAR